MDKSLFPIICTLNPKYRGTLTVAAFFLTQGQVSQIRKSPKNGLW